MAPVQLREGLATAQHGGDQGLAPRSRQEGGSHGTSRVRHITNKIDFPSIGKNVIFCKEKKKKKETLCFFP